MTDIGMIIFGVPSVPCYDVMYYWETKDGIKASTTKVFANSPEEATSFMEHVLGRTTAKLCKPEMFMMASKPGPMTQRLLDGGRPFLLGGQFLPGWKD